MDTASLVLTGGTFFIVTLGGGFAAIALLVMNQPRGRYRK